MKASAEADSPSSASAAMISACVIWARSVSSSRQDTPVMAEVPLISASPSL
ncbi:hypothetical protein D3C87_1251010 [compost metagenome]